MDDMDNDAALTNRVLPLSQYCYRAILANIESFDGFGALPLHLYKPFLSECNADTLSRFEENTPALASSTQDCWHDLCRKDHPRKTELIDSGDEELPDCWREKYFELKDQKQRHLEALETRIRDQRRVAEDKRKERQTVFTEPIVKRSRSSLIKSASLFDKTRKDSIKHQRNVFGPTKVAIMPQAKPRRPASSLSLLPTSATKPTLPIASTAATTSSLNLPPSPPVLTSPHTSPQKALKSQPAVKSTPSHSPTITLPQTFKPAPLSSPSSSPPPHSQGRKDPTASIFMPKHRAHSQRPLVHASPAVVRRS